MAYLLLFLLYFYRIEYKVIMNFSSNLKKAAGKLPEILPNEVKLNLGCGSDVRAGYLNLDIFSDNPEVIYCDIRKLPFESNSVDSIIANDVLDLFSHHETDDILKEWHRVLKPNAEFNLRLPNLKSQIQFYIDNDWDSDILSYMIFGTQSNELEYRAAAFDTKSISKKLLKTGFKIVDLQELTYSQERGYINPKMAIKSIKITDNAINSANMLLINIPQEDETFDDLEIENIENTEYIDDFDYSFLVTEEIDKKSQPDNSNNIDSFIINEDNLIPEIAPSDAINDKDEDLKETLNQDYDYDLFEELLTGEIKEKTSQEHIFPIDEDELQLNIVWEGSQFVYHSLALINREHCSNIIDSNIANLTIIPYENDTFDFNIQNKYIKLAENDIRFKKDVSEKVSNLPYCWIRHQWPPKSEPPQGAKWIIMQPWEFSSLRKDFVELFNQADEIWTPSTFSRKTFVDSGVDTDKIQVIPNGIDPGLFTPYGYKYLLPTKKKLKFLFVGGTIYRKGIDILLKSYVTAFNNQDDVTLIIKDMGGSSFYEGQTNLKMIEDARKISNSPEIIYINEDLREEEIAALYRACNVFVSPYRGEGFSLPVLEAMACGLPVIVTDGGATDDFVDTMYAWKIPSTLKSIGTEMNGKTFAKEAFLLEPDLKELVRILKDVQLKSNSLKMMGILAQYVARTEWTWSLATLKILTRLDYLYGTNMSNTAQDRLNSENDGSILLGEAEANFLAQDYTEATELFKQALQSHGLSKEYRLYALHRLAMIYIAEGNNIDYDNVIHQAMLLDGDNPDTLYVKAIYFASKMQHKEAIAEITQLVNNWENQSSKISLGYTLDDLMVLMGDMVYAEGNGELAHQIYTNALKINNSNEYACYGVGKVFKDSGIMDHAKSMFEWALKINPDFVEAKRELENL